MDLLKKIGENLECFLLNILGEESKSLITEVIEVARFGGEKHPDTDQKAVNHISHAITHLVMEGTDLETGKSDDAHAIVRLLLAIEKIGRDNYKSKSK